MHAVIPWLKSNVWVWPLSIVIGIFFLHVVTLSGLYADGSYMLAWIRYHHWFAGGDLGIHQPRTFMYLVTQWPVVLAVRLGVHDPISIAYLHSFGNYAAPAVAWLFALWRVRNTPIIWFGCMLFALWLNVTFGLFEATCAYALVGASATLLMKRDLSRIDTIALCFMAILLTFSYEAVCLITPALTWMAWRKSRMVAVLFAIASVWMLWCALHPTLPGNARTARDFSLWIQHYQLLCVMLAALLIFARRRALAVIAIGLLLLPEMWAQPWQDGHIRLALALPILAVTLYYAQRRPSISPALALSLVLALCVRDVYHAVKFKEFVNDFRYALERSEPRLRIDEMVTLRSNDYQWSWTQPAMSVVLRPEHTDCMILNGKKYTGAMDAEFAAIGIR